LTEEEVGGAAAIWKRRPPDREGRMTETVAASANRRLRGR